MTPQQKDKLSGILMKAQDLKWDEKMGQFISSVANAVSAAA